MARNILITGAAGRIGSAMTTHLDACSDGLYSLRLGDLTSVGARGIILDITDVSSCSVACTGMDTVIHLAGVVSPNAPFDEVLPINIVGTYNLFRAAADAGVRRVVFASSAQVVEGYPLDVQVRTNMPVRPKNLYGVGKAFGEALASYFAYQEGLEAIAVRIGAFEPSEQWNQLSARDLSAWSESDDLCQLLRLCIEADMAPEPFMIAHGISDNRFKRLDLTDTRVHLGYAPTADAFSVWHVGLTDRSEPVS